MKLYILVSLMILNACSKKSGTSKPDIVGGKIPTTEMNSVITSATVAITSEALLAKGRSFCSGTLVGQKTVVSAAHCFTDESGRLSAGPYLIHFGTTLSDRSLARKIKRIVRHPEYNDSLTVKELRKWTPAHDIALVEFEGETPQTHKPIEVLPSQITLANQLTLAGYGITGDLILGPSGRPILSSDGDPATKNNTGILRYVDVKVKMTHPFGYVFYVAGNGSRTPEGACPGDSGGPAYMKHNNQWYVTGALSTGITGSIDTNNDGIDDVGCLGRNYYTDLRYYTEFIVKTRREFGDGTGATPSNTPPVTTTPTPITPTQPPSVVVTAIPTATPTPAPSMQNAHVFWLTEGLRAEIAARKGKYQFKIQNDGVALRFCQIKVTATREVPFWIFTLNHQENWNVEMNLFDLKINEIKTLTVTETQSGQGSLKQLATSISCNNRAISISAK